ncbi:MAG: T9SS type A sorting domain-containing protein [Flavobacteriales bacterium]|jgi:hypothetical protein|nr:T9SS type A sorting domain-containing protein [Flavobacteriales bacterium]MBK6550843.1 T9SS type A sorting domain-containing protein [Flavobacteriales bacterium]MBK6882398.1 T9SS type A sorting domain-containing protein [Flavobacteriales bacterium]MBK7101387.1 T9SS type A sorting domain-containing protein [Flavobacteriales bacterium]MBK7112095.1 T9SS type A sorting domain-containing protein [Flavobacteriales bacterium]
MKRSLLFTLLGGFAGLISAQTVLVNENFDSYTEGELVAQTIGLPWSTWSVDPGSTEDTPISDEQASSGTLSMKVSGVAAGGPTDLVLRLGDRSTGSYTLSWNMYVPSGNGGYFNIQRNEVPGTGSFMLEVTFKVDGTIEFMNNTVASDGSYPQDTWFSVALAFDLETLDATLDIDGTTQYGWQTDTPGPNQIGGIDFFAYAGGAPNVPLYYVDDVLFTELGPVGIEENALTEVHVYPNPATDVLTVELPHGTTAIASLVDVTGRTVVDGTTFGSRTQFALNGLSKGLYFVRVRENSKDVVRRVIVE